MAPSARVVRWLFCSLVGLTVSANCWTREFKVADAIEMGNFIGPDDAPETVSRSPDGQYVLVVIERGNLAKNCVEDTVLAWRTVDVASFVRGVHSDSPKPIRLAASCVNNSPAITNVRWLSDSSGIAYLRHNVSGIRQLAISRFTGEGLTSEDNAVTPDDQDVSQYDIRNRNVIYLALTVEPPLAVSEAPIAKVGTGKPLNSLLFPPSKDKVLNAEARELWTIIDGKRKRVLLVGYGESLPVGYHTALALSPDGGFAVLTLPLSLVPANWEQYTPYPGTASVARIKSGPQNLTLESTVTIPHSYIVVDLSTGSWKPLLDAPDGVSLGYWSVYTPTADWSPDGRMIVVSPTFLPLPPNLSAAQLEARQKRPCVAVVTIATHRANCIRTLGVSEAHAVEGVTRGGVHFSMNSNDTIVLDFFTVDDRNLTEAHPGHTVYTKRSAEAWEQMKAEQPEITVTIEEGLNEPPVLVSESSRMKSHKILYDPNPQLADASLEKASVLHWKDAKGNAWSGGLIVPALTSGATGYPLVVQTHGFAANQFISSGSYTSAFAARPLAAAGIVVLQIPDCAITLDAEEVACNVAGYRSAVMKLVADGIVDPKRIGIIGFSRTCIFTLAAITTGELHVAAASINDGFVLSYLQYLDSVDADGNFVSRWMNAMEGGPPFDDSLKKWMINSPTFNMDKMSAPLRIEAVGNTGLLFMWEPYATLRYLDLPVDLILISEGTHPLTNPRQRMASQGGNVDWFRFWLQGYEDQDPTKSEQYRRWEKLCDKQKAARGDTSTFCVGTDR